MRGGPLAAALRMGMAARPAAASPARTGPASPERAQARRHIAGRLRNPDRLRRDAGRADGRIPARRRPDGSRGGA
ncbi:hypothetical protein G6F68_012367 [Rhizopus microsporus]|nr:hypothetical protein G6F68_012367 [Rhizopus microsporus]